MIYFSTLFLSLFITIGLIPLSKRLCLRIGDVDNPGGRKIHSSPVPKSGGIAMAFGMAVPLLPWAVADAFMEAVFLGAGVVLLCGFVDDLKSLGWKVKFAAQVAGALIVVLYGGLEIRSLGLLLPQGHLLPAAVAVPLTILVIVGITNAVNLSDGLDGLAGGICLLSFSCIGYLAHLTDNLSVTLVSVAVVGAIVGFMRFNTYPASLFMGDAGSQFLGFTGACLALGLTQGGSPLSPLLPLVILGFPILDTLAVMAERIAAGQSPFQADNRHFHHRLLSFGLYHSEAVMIIYALQAGLVTAALFLRFHSEWLILLGYLLFAVAVVAAFLIGDKTGFRFKRYPLIDRVIKGKLKVLKERAVVIRIAYKAARIGVPALLIISCIMADQSPSYLAYVSFGLLLVVLLSFYVSNGWFPNAVRLALYLLIPVVVYLNIETAGPEWLNGFYVKLYHLSFGLLALVVVLTLKFTRRQSGFKVSPIDIIIIFLAVIVPNLPDPKLAGKYFAVEVIILLFSYEVLLGEMRGKVGRVGLTTMAALAIFGLKGII